MSGTEKQIQWFPGHMAKTLRQMEHDVRNIDVIVEILDSRVPYSSQNPVLKRIGKNKNRMYILTKEDLADDNVTSEWITFFYNTGAEAIHINTKTTKTRIALVSFIDEYLKKHLSNFKFGKPRLMFVGVPNVGKSSVINLLLGQNLAKAEDRPGVTRGKQWFTTEDYELLDMPGVLWPKFESMETGYNLAFTGAIRDEVFDVESIACALLEEISVMYPDNLYNRTKIESSPDKKGIDLLAEFACKRGFLIKGGELDLERAAKAVLYDLRNGKMGKISLERP